MEAIDTIQTNPTWDNERTETPVAQEMELDLSIGKAIITYEVTEKVVCDKTVKEPVIVRVRVPNNEPEDECNFTNIPELSKDDVATFELAYKNKLGVK